MINIQYNIHLILNNKYYLIYKLIITLLMYALISNKEIVLCMNDNTNVTEAPAVAESKEVQRPSHQVLALKNEIVGYAKEHTLLLEKIDKQKIVINNLAEELSASRKTLNHLAEDVASANNKINNQEHQEALHVKENQILRAKIRMLRQQLNTNHVVNVNNYDVETGKTVQGVYLATGYPTNTRSLAPVDIYQYLKNCNIS